MEDSVASTNRNVAFVSVGKIMEHKKNIFFFQKLRFDKLSELSGDGLLWAENSEDEIDLIRE